jgi:hypothetical protein
MHQRIVIVLSWALVLLTQGIFVHAAESYRVHRVVDGDTIILRSDSSPSDIIIRVEGGGKLRQLAARNCDTMSISDPLSIFLSTPNL